MNSNPRDLTQITLAVLFIGGLLLATFWVLKPFLSALIWAAMIVVATWPLMLKAQTVLGGRRALAVSVMSVSILLMLLLPLSLAIATIVENADKIVGWAKWLAESRVPPPPDWVATLPVVGAKLQSFWLSYMASGLEDFAPKLIPHAEGITKWFAAQAGDLSLLFMQFLLIVVLAAILYATGDGAAAWIRRFGLRLGGERGEGAVVLVGQAIRGVALGVVLTALLQSVVGGIGLAIAGIPMAALLTALIFLMCIAQIGAGLVMFAAVAWLFWIGDMAWGVFLLIWSIVVTTMDNFIRPFLIKQGADLPIVLIFAGVIGGLLGFGLVGIFVGPVVLAVSYTLLDAWVKAERQVS
ncbi:MAG: AI-2E family transporter YdiK [Halothiobacillaceae bacterium]|nr:AI-2E family transporter YdiK [Halothiobacillaceae bacterium]